MKCENREVLSFVPGALRVDGCLQISSIIEMSCRLLCSLGKCTSLLNVSVVTVQEMTIFMLQKHCTVANVTHKHCTSRMD